MEQKLLIERLKMDVIMPRKMTSEAAGVDLYSPEEKILPARKLSLIPLAIRVSF